MPRSSTKPPQAKVHRSYLVEEVATLYGCLRNTVATWVAEGLAPIDDRYPMMFHGTSLNDFHRRRRASRKCTCGPGEIYCVVCRAPQVPAGGMVEYQPRTDKMGTVTAMCPSCDGLIRQAVGAERLGHFVDRYTVTRRAPTNALVNPPAAPKTMQVTRADLK